MRIALVVTTATLAALAACGPPINNTPVEQVPSIKNLEALMDVQATVADPQFKKIGAATFTDEDFTAFAEVGRKIDATSKHLKDFTKGPEFDAFAARLGEKATALSKAAETKSADGARTALTEMKATCRECHSKFK
jgi:cytochrome c556